MYALKNYSRRRYHKWRASFPKLYRGPRYKIPFVWTFSRNLWPISQSQKVCNYKDNVWDYKGLLQTFANVAILWRLNEIHDDDDDNKLIGEIGLWFKLHKLRVSSWGSVN